MDFIPDIREDISEKTLPDIVKWAELDRDLVTLEKEACEDLVYISSDRALGRGKRSHRA
jgi:hypothetical protein